MDFYPEYNGVYTTGYAKFFEEAGLNKCDKNSYDAAYEEMDKDYYGFSCKYFGEYCDGWEDEEDEDEEGYISTYSQTRAQAKPSHSRRMAQLKNHALTKRQ